MKKLKLKLTILKQLSTLENKSVFGGSGPEVSCQATSKTG